MSPPAVHHAIDVAASPEACWKVLADLGSWGRWFPRTRYAAVLGGERDPWRLGGRFEILFDFGIAVSVKPEVREIEPARRVRWVGRAWGVEGNHAYSFESHAPGVTRVTSHEEFSGVGARLITRKVFDLLDLEVHRSMDLYKALVEAR